MNKEEFKRYNRQIILSEIGISGQQKLKSSKVLVIGAGGLGCPVLQYLAAAGVGKIGIVDDDIIDETNLHRQVLYAASDVGQSKALTAAEKLRSSNPFIETVAYTSRLSAGNVEEVISDFDLIIDGSDNFETRYLINDACVKLDKPFVYGAISGFEGQVSLFNYQNGPTYRCVFPTQGDTPNCTVNGVLGILPGIVGTCMANEALKVILQIGETLSGKLFVLNVLENSFRLFTVSRSIDPVSSALPTVANQEQEPMLNHLHVTELENLLEQAPESVFLIDVREPQEFEAGNIGGLNIPLSEITDEADSFPTDKMIVFYCQTGKRSKMACNILRETGFTGKIYWI